MRFQQKDLSSATWDTVQAGQHLEYAFDEPLLSHKIRVVLFAENGYLDQAMHEYPLDIIKVSFASQPPNSFCPTGALSFSAASIDAA